MIAQIDINIRDSAGCGRSSLIHFAFPWENFAVIQRCPKCDRRMGPYRMVRDVNGVLWFECDGWLLALPMNMEIWRG